VTLAAPERGDGALVDDELWPDEPPGVAPGDDPVVVLADVPAELAVACAEPGRVKASPPATASPRAPVPAVTARSRVRARSRRTTADTVRGSLRFINAPSTEVNTLRFPQRPVAEVPVSSAAALNDWLAHLPGAARFACCGPSTRQDETGPVDDVIR
jgi:hypothetical protein